MKLFTKIFLQVICVVLLLSSGIFFYTTYRWKNQSIQNINSYENSRFQTNISKFENMLMRIKSKTQDTDDKIREKMIIYDSKMTSIVINHCSAKQMATYFCSFIFPATVLQT